MYLFVCIPVCVSKPKFGCLSICSSCLTFYGICWSTLFKINVCLCSLRCHSTVVAWFNSVLWQHVVVYKLWMGTVMTGWLAGACQLFSLGGNAFAFVFISLYVSATSLFDAVFVIASSVPERFKWHRMFRCLSSTAASQAPAVHVSEWLLEASSWKGLHSPVPGPELPRRTQGPGRPPGCVSGWWREWQGDCHHKDHEEEKEKRGKK